MRRLKINLEAIERDGNANGVEGFCADGGVRVGSLLVSSDGVRDSAGHRYDLSSSEFDVVPESEGGFLGKGSSGSVRRAIHRRSNMVVALKEIKVTGQAHINEIRRELETLHAGDSLTPNLVNFYGAFTHEGSVYIAMEAMDGSLQEMQKPVPLRALAAITRQMLKGLVYLHRTRHLMHRDLKPSNVLYNSRTGDIKISDFGVSSFLECTKADAHSFVGTVTYMSPERLHGDSYSYGADIWSLGLVVAELAIGECPFAGLRGESNEGRFWALIQHLNGVGPALELPPEMDPTLASFINACVVKAPEQRATCTALLRHPFLRTYGPTAAVSAEGADGGVPPVQATTPSSSSAAPAPSLCMARLSSTLASSPPLNFSTGPSFDRLSKVESSTQGCGNNSAHRTTAMMSPGSSPTAVPSPMERHDGESGDDVADRFAIRQWLHTMAERAARRRHHHHHHHHHPHPHRQPPATAFNDHASAVPATAAENGSQPAASRVNDSQEGSSHSMGSCDTESACASREGTVEAHRPACEAQPTAGEPSVNLDDELNKLLF